LNPERYPGHGCINSVDKEVAEKETDALKAI